MCRTADVVVRDKVDRDIRAVATEDLHHLRMTGEEENLVASGHCQDPLRGLGGAGRVEIDQDVVHQDRQCLTAAAMAFDVAEPDGEVELLGCPSAQRRYRLTAPLGIDHFDLFGSIMWHEDLRVTAAGDARKIAACMPDHLRLVSLLESLLAVERRCSATA